MRKLIKLVLFLIVLLIVAAIAIPFLVPLSAYKKEIIAHVKEATGRDLEIAGDIKATIFPVLGIDVERASFSNPSGYASKYMLQVDRLTLDVDVTALLSKKIQVKRFILAKPVINLETDAQGKPNWEFDTAKSGGAQESATASADDSSAASTALGGLMLGEVKLTDGEINYRDGKNKQVMSLTDINLAISLPSLSSAFNADGSAVWNSEKIKLAASVAQPQALVGGKTSPFELDVNAAPVTLSYKGAASMQSAKGAVSLNIPSLPALAKWSGSAFDWKGKAPLAFASKGDLQCSVKACALTGGDITLDDIAAKGALQVEFGGAKPKLDAQLDTGMLDLNPYLPQKQASNGWFISTATAAQWSSDPIDLSGLRAVDANLKLKAEGVKYEKITLQKTVLDMVLAGGVLKLSIPEAALYGGSLKLNTALDASGAMQNQLTLSGVQAEPFLKDAADYDRLSGTLNTTADINGRLTSQRDLMASLGGSGNIKFNDGAIKGVDLAGMIRNIQSAYKDVDTSQKKTDFSEMGGTYTINQGVVSNNDLSLKAPLLRLKGEGTVNLPLQAINYRLTPEVVATAQGQGGKDKQGLQVPVLVTGSFDNPQFTPDLAGMAQKAIENPEAIKETVKSVKEQIKGGKTDLKGLLKGFGR